MRGYGVRGLSAFNVGARVVGWFRACGGYVGSMGVRRCVSARSKDEGRAMNQ